MSDKIFLDSNILLYSIRESEQRKLLVARKLIEEQCVVSPQVLFESLNVALKEFKLSKEEAIRLVKDFARDHTVVAETIDVVTKAFELFEKLSISPYDSKIIAAALLSDCTILYSEDLHHGLVIENKLRIVNPFL